MHHGVSRTFHILNPVRGPSPFRVLVRPILSGQFTPKYYYPIVYSIIRGGRSTCFKES